MNNIVKDVESFKRIKFKENITDTSYERRTLFILIQSLKENKLAMVCLVFIAMITIVSILSPLSPYDPDKIDLANKLQDPSFTHPFGTDELGRDYLTRALYGGRVSIAVGVCSMLISIILGTTIGATSGYMGGKIDTVLMRCIDIFMSVPSLLFIIIINTLFTPNIFTLIFAISIFAWMGVARIVRANTLSLKERDFVLAAKSLGVSNINIIIKHVIPNIMPQIIVAASISIARAILQESSLSFLGYGVQLPKSSWGSMLQNAQQFIFDTPLLAFVPGLLILLTVLSFNILGDIIRDLLEPKTIR